MSCTSGTSQPPRVLVLHPVTLQGLPSGMEFAGGQKRVKCQHVRNLRAQLLSRECKITLQLTISEDFSTVSRKRVMKLYLNRRKLNYLSHTNFYQMAGDEKSILANLPYILKTIKAKL